MPVHVLTRFDAGSGKLEKDTVLYVTLVAQFKGADDAARQNMVSDCPMVCWCAAFSHLLQAQNIFSQFLEPSSSSYLPFLDEEKRLKTQMNLQEKQFCPPVSLFDLQLMEAIASVDQSGLFKKFQKSKQPERKKKHLFKSMTKKQGKAAASGLKERRLSRKSVKEDEPEKPRDDRLDRLIY